MSLSSSYKPRAALAAAACIGLGLALAAASAYISGRLRATDAASAQLTQGREAAQQVLGLRFQRLQLMSQAMAGDSSFVGYVLETAAASNDPFGGGQGGSGSVKDLLTERQGQVGFDFGMVLDPNGGLIAATGDGKDDLSGDPLFAPTMRARGDQSGYWLHNGRLYQVVVARLANHDQQAGYLVLAMAVTQAELLLLKRNSDAEQLVYDVASGAYLPVASTLPGDEVADLGKRLQALPGLPRGAFELSSGSGRWLAYADPLGSQGDGGVMVMLLSRERGMDDVYGLLRLLLAELLVTAVLAFGLDYWLVRRSPAWPKRQA